MRILFVKRVLPGIAVAGVLTACTIGTEFVRPPADFVHLGETTRTEVIERLGKPQKETLVRIDGRQLRGVAYFFGSEEEAPKIPRAVCIRTLLFILSDEIVVGEHFTSSCASDHTDFDEHKAGDIVKGKTRCDEVIAMMGRPNVRGIYPAVERKGELEIGYQFEYVAVTGLTHQTYKKSLMIYCNPDGVVRDTAFTEAISP